MTVQTYTDSAVGMMLQTNPNSFVQRITPSGKASGKIQERKETSSGSPAPPAIRMKMWFMWMNPAICSTAEFLLTAGMRPSFRRWFWIWTPLHMNLLAFIQSADHHEMQQSGVHGHSEEQKENSFFTFFQQGGTMIIRSATPADTARLLEIYSWYVENTAVTYEYESPSMDEFGRRISNTLERYPYFVLENDNMPMPVLFTAVRHIPAAVN